ncbi:hypothetical protein CRM22_001958 [Opisthorchis felineus]|uniref:Uncharacterized protein n=1 Tax=Opisthorchis felineus TaxID=147828 RepID=A0A4S2MEN9_OPIFE|nr:hypothetical protein CRM22_001958 [Opisthorchis felineus]
MHRTSKTQRRFLQVIPSAVGHSMRILVFVTIAFVASSQEVINDELTIDVSGTTGRCNFVRKKDLSQVGTGREELSLSAKSVGFVSSSRDTRGSSTITPGSETASVTVPRLVPGEMYNLTCSQKIGSREIHHVELTAGIESTIPGLVYSISEVTLNSVTLTFTYPDNALKLYYRSMQQSGACLSTSSPVTGRMQGALIAQTVSINGERFQYWFVAERHGQTLPAVAGSLRKSLAYSIIAAQRTGDIITFKKNGELDSASDVVGVYHDTCGNCEAVLLPSCEENVKEEFLKVAEVVRFCRLGLPTRCAVGSVASSATYTNTYFGAFTRSTTTTAELQVTEPDGFDHISPNLDIWFSSSLRTSAGFPWDISKFKLSKSTSNQIEISINGTEDIEYKLHYRSLKQQDGRCILPKSVTSTKITEELTALTKIFSTEDRIQYWITSEKMAYTPRITAGTTKVKSSANTRISSVERRGNTLELRMRKALEETESIVGVFHDGCGSCEGVLLPYCTEVALGQFIQFTDVKDLCMANQPRECVPGSISQPIDRSSQTVLVTIPDVPNFDTSSFILTTWTDLPLKYSGAPRIQVTLGGLEVNQPRLSWNVAANLGVTTFRIVIWKQPDSEQIISVGTATSWVLLGLMQCTEYTVQVVAVKYGLPLLEISSSPLRFTIPENEYTPVLSVTNRAAKVVHASWTKPTGCGSSNYVYRLTVKKDDFGPVTVRVAAPKTEHLFTNLDHCAEYHFLLTVENPNVPGWAVNSNKVVRRTMPETLDGPTNVSVSSTSGSQLTVSWTKNEHWAACGALKHVVTVVPLGERRSTSVTVADSPATVNVEECRWYGVYVQTETDSRFRSFSSQTVFVKSSLRPYDVPDFQLVNVISGAQIIRWGTGVEWINECYRLYEVSVQQTETSENIDKFNMSSGTPGRIVDGLTPCKEYRYVVGSGSKFKNKKLMTLPSSFLPVEMTAVATSSNTIRVNWNVPQCSESFGGIQYTLIAKPTDIGLGTITQKLVGTTWKSGPVTISVEPCTTYHVHMDVDALGVRDRSEAVIVTVPDDISGTQAPTVTIINVEPGVQKVSWTAPDKMPKCRHLYEIERRTVDSEEKITVRTSSTERTFVQLAHCTNYEYTVLVVGEYVDIKGSVSNAVRLTTMTPKPERPTITEVTVSNPTSMELKWSTPTPHDRCSHTGYIVMAQAATAPTIELTSGPRYATLSTESCTSYLVTVQTQYPNGIKSDKSDFKAVTTPAYEPAAPVDFKITRNSPREQILSWNYPDPPYKCSHIYELERSEIGHSGITIENTMITSPPHEYVVQSLKPWTTYSYRLRVVGQPGNVAGPYSAVVIQPTEPEESFAAAISELVSPIGSTEATITVNLKLSKLVGFPTLDALSLVVQPQHEQAEIRRESTTFTSLFPSMVDQSWAGRIQQNVGPWEVKLWHKSLEALFQAFDDTTIDLGRTVTCNDSAHCQPGKLMPGTTYGIQLRIYSSVGVLTSRQIFSSTRTDLSSLAVLMAFIVSLATGAIIIVLLGLIFPLPETEQVSLPKPKSEEKERVKSFRRSKQQKERSESIRMTRTQGHHVARIGKTIDELRAYLDDCLQPLNRHLHEEYSALRKDCLKREISENLTTNYATEPKNHALNRYPDIIPYDQTVVLLGRGSIPGEEVKYYINASYIYAVTSCKDAYTAPQLNPEKVEYIAAQGPMKKTIVDFWEMVAENHISLIVMLTQLVEKNVPKCAAYWPDEVNATVIHMCHGKELAVTLISEEDYPSYVIRRFSLVSGTDESEPAIVTQLHMKLWPDHGVPDLAEFAAVLNEYQKLKMSDLNKDAPTLVHCSAGVGRTGIFIAADIIKRQMDSDVEWFDIRGTVSQLRFCRMHMVQKVDQYVFLHQFVRSLLDERH